MRIQTPIGGQNHRGAVLIVLLVALLAGSGLWLLEAAEANRRWQNHREVAAESLGFAKEALIAYAVNYADNYGHKTRGGSGRLPCPAIEKHDSPAPKCIEGETGYLPAIWKPGKKVFDIDHIEKFLDQDLWYSLSPAYRFNPSFNALNSDSKSDQISVGSVDDVVAIIIAPGSPLPGQNRLRDNPGITDYLEGENADGDLEFAFADSVGRKAFDITEARSSNDQLVWIRQSELMPLVERRVLGYVKQWLNEYYLEYGYYPYAAPFDDQSGECQTGLTGGRLPMGKSICGDFSLGEFVSSTVEKSRPLGEIWFAGSQWPDFIHYQVDPACTATGSATECQNTSVSGALLVEGTPVKVLLVNAGSAIEPADLGRLQSREIENRSMVEYFEVPDLLGASTSISFRDVAMPTNDQYVVIE